MTHEVDVDIAVIGGGTGGVAAALAAARAGKRVLVSEPTDWIGGQFTSQAVPPDEHRWIEQFGCTASYRELRDGIREYYRRWYPLTAEALSTSTFNPGAAGVSALSTEPRAALAVMEAMLSPYISTQRVDLRLHHTPIAADVQDDEVAAVTLEDSRTRDRTTVRARYFLDATETGDLLPLSGAEYVTGFESQAQTGEPSAPAEAQPLNMQSVTWCFALEHQEGQDHTIDRPANYAYWRDFRPPYWPDRMLSLTATHPITLEPRHWHLQPNPEPAGAIRASHRGRDFPNNLWIYRRVLARPHFTAGFADSDISIVNWPMVDYVDGPVFEVDPQEAQRHLDGAKQMSLSFLYWLQTEAPRPDGGTGIPGLRLRPDVTGTDDGLAKMPYIRESRRIRAECTVREQDVAMAVRGESGTKSYQDSVGIGMYRIDLHPSTGGDNYIDVASTPFEIPLGALLPQRMRNLLPANKNIGTTHITNGCYRLHPVEWNIGESAALLATYCLDSGVRPHDVRAKQDHLEDYQKSLTRAGVELHWPQISGY